jgi:hypothetical protein
MRPRLVFLDVDGVLRTWPPTHPFTTNAAGRKVASYNCHAVAAFNWLMETTQATLVMTSTWREQGKRGMQDDLQDWGVQKQIDSMVERNCRPWCGEHCDRSHQITRWLARYRTRHGVKDWNAVALDDDPTRGQGWTLIQTTIEEGLTWEKAESARAYLMRQSLP